MGWLVKTWRKVRWLAAPWARSSAATLTCPPVEIPLEPDHERLARLAGECLTGNLAGAELELHTWSRESSCPDAARVLLAALLTRHGRMDDARAVLNRRENPAQQPGADFLQLLIANLVSADLPEAARRLIIQLFHAHGDDEAVALWLQLMELPGMSEMPALPDARIERLANELVAQPRVIPSLVAAQRIAPVMADLAILRAALGLAARQFNTDTRQAAVVCQAMAELALLADDKDDARRWAHRGLKINPYAAPLALVLARVEDDPALGPPATTILREAVSAHPQYADLRAALIQREKHDGRSEAARLHLADWLRQEPDNPLARKLESELAA
ncbi:MAG: hypothetical protein IT444_14065 [Phycisphaeraceae bacterium]|nr:hypothetical protein [Phycisphaeraceae bacterium]